MKKSIIFLMLVTLLWACNNSGSLHDKSADAGAGHSHEAVKTQLALNNGAKWKADAPTNQNVADLRAVAQHFSKEPHTGLSEYQVVGADLQKGLDKMIKECKMSGADHDALHLWLEPILKNVKELNKAADTQSAEKSFHAIDERLNMYPQYFE